jgi:O-antigen/teichoic acid export membrane protein
MVTQLLSGLLQLLAIVIIARVLGPDGNGQYVVALLVPTMLATLLNLGIAPANVYFLGAGKVDVSTVLKTMNRLAFMIVIAGLCFGFLVIHFYGSTWFPNTPEQLIWGALIIFPFALYKSFLSSIFQGKQEFHYYNLLIVLPPGITLVLLALLALFGLLTIENALAARLGGFLLPIFFAKWRLFKDIKKQPASEMSGYMKKVIGYGYKAHFSNILAFLNYKADIFLINYLMNPVAVGIYVVAVQLVERLWLFSQSVSTVILPWLSGSADNEDKRREMTPLICRLVIATTLVFSLLLAILAYPFITLVFGSEYSSAVIALLILLPGIVAGAGARILAVDVAARGKPQLNMYFSLIVIVVNLSLNILLIPQYGINGAAIATTIAYSTNLFFRLLVYKYLTGSRFGAALFITLSDLRRLKKVLKGHVFAG